MRLKSSPILTKERSLGSFFGGESGVDIVAPGRYAGEVNLYRKGQLTVVRDYDSPRAYMEALCLVNGTTLAGSYEASGYLLSGAYKRPIFIGGRCGQIFIPTSALKDENGVWLNLDFCLREPVDAYNRYGYKPISPRSWRKHVADGIALYYAIFEKAGDAEMLC